MLLVSNRFILLSIKLARFADPGLMLLPEVLYTTHPDFDIFVTNWALHLAIVDDKTLKGVLRARYVFIITLHDVVYRLTVALASSLFGSGKRSGAHI